LNVAVYLLSYTNCEVVVCGWNVYVGQASAGKTGRESKTSRSSASSSRSGHSASRGAGTSRAGHRWLLHCTSDITTHLTQYTQFY